MSYQDLIENLKKARSKIENSVINGQVADFASYRFLTGQIKGLQAAIDICRTMFNINNEEER